jgi:enoyl-CoA hydratase
MVRGLSHLNLHWMKYLVLTGLPLTAEDARLAGLVNQVVPAGDHLAAARKLAETITARSPLALAVGKAFLNRGNWAGQAHITESNTLLQGAPDFADGIAAFVDGRPPAF